MDIEVRASVQSGIKDHIDGYFLEASEDIGEVMGMDGGASELISLMDDGSFQAAIAPLIFFWMVFFKRRFRELEGERISYFCLLIDDWSAWVSESKEFSDLIKAFANSIIDGGTNDLVISGAIRLK